MKSLITFIVTLVCPTLVAFAQEQAPAGDSAVIAAESVFADYKANSHFDQPLSSELVKNHLAQKAQSEELTPAQRAQYLSDNSWVQTHNPLVRRLSELIVDGAQTDRERVVLIHNFVVWRMSFYPDYLNSSGTASAKEALLTRKGKFVTCFQRHSDDFGDDKISFKTVAGDCGMTVPIEFSMATENLVPQVIFTGSWNCAGYAVLFSALARSAGIPSRVVNQTSDENTFHIWNQVYIDGTWRVVDSTYDDTLEDHGQYEDDSIMKLRGDYLLVSPDGAANADLSFHPEKTPLHSKWQEYEIVN